MQQNIVLSIQDSLQQLPKSERKIAEYILKNTETVISMNAQELAKQAGSSPAAIIRFCHSMDVNGFTELKLLLSANLGQMKQQMYTEVTKGESTADIKQKLQARFVHVVERSGQTLEDVAVNEAVDLLEKTEVIFVYGLGASSLVAQDIYQKFTRLGRTVFTTLDHHLFASMLGSTEKPSVFIVISNSGTNKEASTLADLAKQQGIPIISITQDEKSVIGEKSDIVLQTSSGEDVPLRSAATVSLVAQLYVVDVLFFAYAAKNYKETLEKIQISRKNVERLKE
ncbi:TPA: MurR/RpiR family transcriptional regulator [Enterococcus faecalis]|nr:MurR/RpiR family transcriptional regulator [Enterococcus faecalis]